MSINDSLAEVKSAVKLLNTACVKLGDPQPVQDNVGRLKNEIVVPVAIYVSSVWFERIRIGNRNVEVLKQRLQEAFAGWLEGEGTGFNEDQP